MAKMTGAEAILECLKEERVKVVFGLPGGVLLPLYDAIYSSDLRHILVRHEQAAAHAADGYARATGEVGVCLATSGPGATNLVTGIANAYMDSVPMVAMTGQVPTALIGRDAFQEADITGITLPITKHNYLLKKASEIPRSFREAFYIARTGRPGPVLIDLPKDVTMEEMDFTYPPINLPGYNPSVKAHPLQIRRAAEALMSSQRPVIYVGGGVKHSDAHEELIQLALKLSAPVTTTLMGIGTFPEDHPLSLGMLGMHGTKYANYAVQEADLLLAVGARFDDRVTGRIASFAPNARIIHIDIDPAEIGKNVKVDIPLVGDAKNALTDLIKAVEQKPRSAWNEKIDHWKGQYPLSYKCDDEDLIRPQMVVEKICEICPDAIIVTEVGQNQMWAAQFFTHRDPYRFISSGGLGTMGYGFPAAIGAKVGRPDAQVFDIAGDGSFQMNIQELATAVLNDIPVKVAILNNGVLGMVRQWQNLFHGKRFSHTTLGSCPDFVKVAEAYGALGLRATKPSQVEDVIREALASDKPTVMDFVVPPDEMVSPMVPAGASLSEILELEG